MHNEISVVYEYNHSVAKEDISNFLGQVMNFLGVSCDILEVAFVSKEKIKDLNRTFRQKDKPTDVLSFRGENTVDGYLLGTIVISPEVVVENEKIFCMQYEKLLKLVLIHGLLHLLGYDHENDYGEMETLEDLLIRIFIEE